MNLLSQTQPLHDLEKIALTKRQNVIISGYEGVGKTYLAKQYASMLDIDDIVSVSPKVDQIRQSVDACLMLDHPVMMCIENLDTGVVGASYTLLKFLEEPSPDIYVVVTCRNLNHVPDTIISRCECIDVPAPSPSDIVRYAEFADASKYKLHQNSKIWKYAKSLKDADAILKMTAQQVTYICDILSSLDMKKPVSDIVWKIGHFEDNSEAPLNFVINSIVDQANNKFITSCGIECLRDLSYGRIASHAVISKFVLQMKYYE